MSAQQNDAPKRIAFVSCEKQTFKINTGDGHQTVKWLALATCQKIAHTRRGRGRITSRSPNVDGRLNTLPIPQCVTVGRQQKWLHPATKISEVHARYGSTCVLCVTLAYRPKLIQGVHARSVWCDLAFGGERGEERYQAWVAEQRSNGTWVSDGDEEGKDNASDEKGGDDDKDNVDELLRLEFEDVSRGIKLEKYGSEMEKTKVLDYLFKYYVVLRDSFHVLTLEHLTSRGLSNPASTTTPKCVSLADLIHFCWHHDLDFCCTGLHRTTSNDKNGENNKAVLAQLEEENIVRSVARQVVFGEQNGSVGVSEEGEERKESTLSSISSSVNGGEKMKIYMPQFFEILIWFAAVKREKNAGKKKNQGTLANAIALRQMLQRLEGPINRRRNESVRKLMVTRSIARVVTDTATAVQDVFENYCTADADKDRKDERYQSVMSLHEFRLLMTDALLIGARPGDDVG
jgi:hypothetical protein